MQVGEIYNTNFDGQCTVVEYKSSVNVVVRFHNTGNLEVAQSGAIRRGLVRDRVLRQKLIAERQAAELTEKRARAERVAEDKRIAKLEEERKAEELRKEAEAIKDSKHWRHKYIGKHVVDVIDMTYEIIGWAEPSQLRIRYYDGNEYDTDTISVGRRTAMNTDSEHFETAKRVMISVKSAKSYQKNRDKCKAAATAYQKDNKERTVLRNRNRRAVLAAAEGSTTKAEEKALLVAQGSKCGSCGEDIDYDSGHLDHIVALRLGGSNNIDNRQWLCRYCNQSKSRKSVDVWKAYRETDAFREGWELAYGKALK